MLRLPPANSIVRTLIDIDHLAETCALNNRSKLPTFREALSNCRTTMAADRGVRSMTSLAYRANGELWLIRVGCRGGWSRVWNFGRL